MKEQDFVARMKEANSLDDYEVGHSTADGILIEVLRQLGWNALADEYENEGRYYA